MPTTFAAESAESGTRARFTLPHRMWRELGRRWLVVLLLSFVMSTEILFIPATYEGWTLIQIFNGWFEQFLDSLTLGIGMMLAVTFADGVLKEENRWRLPALALVVIVSGALSYAGLTVFHFPAGFYPPALQVAGEALRAVLLGTMVTLVWAVQKRNAREARRLQRLEIDRVALNRRMLEAQLQVMEAQIEPHFLFNTLATVKRLYQTTSASGERMLDSLQLYLRSAIPRIRGENSTLSSECVLVGAYLDVLQIRMGDRLGFAIALPKELEEINFPPMMLITLVENAIKHGLNQTAAGGRIDIFARLQDGILEVEVSDTGVGFQASSGHGIGLANIRSRLAALYGGQAQLTLEPRTPNGVTCLIRVPHEQGLAA